MAALSYLSLITLIAFILTIRLCLAEGPGAQEVPLIRVVIDRVTCGDENQPLHRLLLDLQGEVNDFSRIGDEAIYRYFQDEQAYGEADSPDQDARDQIKMPLEELFGDQITQEQLNTVKCMKLKVARLLEELGTLGYRFEIAADQAKLMPQTSSKHCMLLEILKNYLY